MNKIDRIVLYLVAVVSIVGLFLPSAKNFLGGTSNFDTIQLTPATASENAIDARNSAGTSMLVVDGNGTTTISGKLKLNNCTSNTSFNPASFSSSSVASTTVGLLGAGIGDYVFSTFATTTNANEWVILPGTITAVGAMASATVEFHALVASDAYVAGLNLATGTLTTCYFDL